MLRLTSTNLLVASLAVFLLTLSAVIWLRFIPLKNEHAVYYSDFVQMYLTGNAIASGVPIYEPLPELAEHFDPAINNDPHPSAYPPPFALLGLPLSPLTYMQAFMLWGSIEIGCFLLTVFLLVRHFRGFEPEVLATASLFVCWQPFYADLYQGQIMMLALLLLTSAWLALTSGRDVKAGIFLAVLASLKLYGLPIFLFLLIAKKRKAALTTIGGAAMINMVTVAMFGLETYITYVQRVAPAIAQIYGSHPLNFSVVSVLGEPAALAVLTAGLVMASRVQDFDRGFLIALTISTVLNPVAWIHYFVTLLPVGCFLVCKTKSKARSLLVLAAVGICVGADVWFYHLFGVRGLPLLLVLVLTQQLLVSKSLWN